MKLEDAIKGILHYREQIHKEHLWDNPVALSETLVKLATYNAYLADNIAVLHKKATDKAYAIFTEAKAGGETVTSAEQMARGESTQERKQYEQVKDIHKSTDNLVSVIQSRLRVVENQIKREGQL